MEQYPIGTPGQPWGDAERREWFATQTVQRSYRNEVLDRIATLDDSFDVEWYGALPIDPDRYPLMSVTVRSERPDAPWVLITGGVHGYETSGVHGALGALQSVVPDFRDRVNFLVAPCVSPWGYETINRWNPNCVDPNRSFVPDSPSDEAAALLDLVRATDVDFVMHLDLHETTDTDETEFRPALAARDGLSPDPGVIPDGFYTVGDTENPQPEFQAVIIAGVAAVTHIAPADDAGQIIGTDVTQPGVINYPVRQLGLCAGITEARYTTTTEVYPDSPAATPHICIDAQVAAVRAALELLVAAD
ncbi:MAG: M14 family metallocarboxypeptidase [Ilumatobacter sp.]